MKNILKILSFIVFTSCADDLNISPPSELTTAGFFRNAEDIEKVVVSSYGYLQSEGEYGENFHFLMEVPSDNSTETSLTIRGGDFGQLEIFSVATSNQVPDETWVDCYKGIQSCNVVLNRIDGIDDMESSLKEVRKGEVSFIRALTYFNMVRIWGEVPLVTQETEDPYDYFDIGKSSVQEIYDQIIFDLNFAKGVLPARQSDAGRATKGAAHALLGKVYLTLKDYDNTIAELRNVTGYSLLPDYNSIFGSTNENNIESIFEVQFISGTTEGNALTNLFTPVGYSSDLGVVGAPSGHNSPTQELFDSYELTDRRRDVVIGTIDSRYYPKKYIEPIGLENDSPVNVIVLRYADVLLMLAEALNETAYVADGEAFTLLNQIRNRSRLGNLTAAELPDQNSFRVALANERRLELAFENHRWFDLLRTGKALEVMNAKTSYTVEAYQLLFPIPQSAIDTNPDVLFQNTGY